MAGWVQDLVGTYIAGGSSFTTAAFGTPTSTGNLLVVTIGDDGGVVNAVTAINDSRGNIWTKIVSVTAFDDSCMWYAPLMNGGASHTVTVRFNSAISSRYTYVFQEFSGTTATPLDVSTSAVSAHATLIQSGTTATTTQASEIVVMSGQVGSNPVTFTAGAGFSNVGQATESVGGVGIGQESKVISAIGTQSGNISQNSTDVQTQIGIIATFRIGAFALGDSGANYSSPRHVIVGDGMSRSEVAN